MANLIFSMINRKGLTLYMELRGYMEIAHPKLDVSTVAYLKQRMKLNPAAIEYLYKGHNRKHRMGLNRNISSVAYLSGP